jgi:hypothetical protein
MTRDERILLLRALTFFNNEHKHGNNPKVSELLKKIAMLEHGPLTKPLTPVGIKIQVPLVRGPIECRCGSKPKLYKQHNCNKWQYAWDYFVECPDCGRKTTKCTYMPEALDIWKVEFSVKRTLNL